MIERNIRGISDFLGALQKDQDGAATWFRGHAKASWTLLPGIMRSVSGLSEASSLARFKQSAAMLTERSPSSAFDWTFLMQHYGVPTVTIHDDDLDLIEDMFSRLNEAVPLNAAEKRNAFGGRLVAAITEVSQHDFFVEKVRFGNGRYQHREVAARLLLIEDSLSEHSNLVDTKKVYLDALAHRYSKNKKKVDCLKGAVTSVLDAMSAEFVKKDELLQAQGIMVVYYLLFKGAIKTGQANKITRKKLLNFRQKLAENRELAAKNYALASFDLLEFDRLNQQGTNDASSIKERYRVLASALRVPILTFPGTTDLGQQDS